MAVYLLLEKQTESTESAEYRVELADGRAGLIRLVRDSDEVLLVVPIPGDEKGLLFARASYKLSQHWAKRLLPDKLSWAS